MRHGKAKTLRPWNGVLGRVWRAAGRAGVGGLGWLASRHVQEFSVSCGIRLLQTDGGWSVSCLDLPGGHSRGDSQGSLEVSKQAWTPFDS
jgi:hypothetical protein